MAIKDVGNLESLRFEIQDDSQAETRIKVIGVGGGGSNAVARMIQDELPRVELYVLNTDRQALEACPVPNKLAIGQKLTNGRGAGGDPNIGREAALEDTDKIIEILQGADMVFVAAGLGGGTGTGAAPVVASLAKELNALTVAIVTKPFAFEGPQRSRQAERGLAELAACVDAVIPIPNDRLLELVTPGTSLFEAFRLTDDVLRHAVQGISDIIATPGAVNRDFSDIRALMQGTGYAMMGAATAEGKNAAVEAARAAINYPLLEAGGIKGARGILVNFTGSSSLSLHDVFEACQLIRRAAENEEVQLDFGLVSHEAMQNVVKVTVIATGFERDTLPAIQRRASESRPASAPAPAPAPHRPAHPAPGLQVCRICPERRRTGHRGGQRVGAGACVDLAVIRTCLPFVYSCSIRGVPDRRLTASHRCPIMDGGGRAKWRTGSW